MKSIILRDWEVRGILEGRISQLRRPIKPKPDHFHRDILNGHNNWDKLLPQIGDREIKCPFGQVGDLIWGKETFWEEVSQYEVGESGDEFRISHHRKFHYDADGLPPVLGNNDWGITSNTTNDGKPRRFIPSKGHSWWTKSPSIHMPRRASRITLQTDEIWAERLQEITVDDAHKCGFDYLHEEAVPYQIDIGTSFVSIWNHDYQKQGLGWDANPWVFSAKVHRVEAKA